MKYYKNKNKDVFGFELDGSQDHLITEDMIEFNIEIDDSDGVVKSMTIEEIRINSIKAFASQIITSRYSIVKQLNIYGEGGEAQIEMVAWIKKIRDISNRAESDGTALADINWEI